MVHLVIYVYYICKSNIIIICPSLRTLKTMIVRAFIPCRGALKKDFSEFVFWKQAHTLLAHKTNIVYVHVFIVGYDLDPYFKFGQNHPHNCAQNICS